MGQIEVLVFLKKNRGKWFSSRELQDVFGLTRQAINYNVRDLGKYGLIRKRFSALRRSGRVYGGFEYAYEEDGE